MASLQTESSVLATHVQQNTIFKWLCEHITQHFGIFIRFTLLVKFRLNLSIVLPGTRLHHERIIDNKKCLLPTKSQCEKINKSATCSCSIWIILKGILNLTILLFYHEYHVYTAWCAFIVSIFRICTQNNKCLI